MVQAVREWAPRIGRRRSAPAQESAPAPNAPSQAAGQPQRTARCAILTPSGALLARGRVSDRTSCPDETSWELRLTDVAPPGALEALFHANQPEVVLRTGQQAELALWIDHITGPPNGRTYWLRPINR